MMSFLHIFPLFSRKSYPRCTFRFVCYVAAGVLCGFSDGEDAVEEVVEFLGSGEVVLSDGACEVSFRGMGDDEQAPSVLFLEIHQFHHEDAIVIDCISEERLILPSTNTTPYPFSVEKTL